ncbi:cytochrome c biogenesis CcdA family protein [Rhodopseudomonas sp. P2A-2r]|uniref:cytochrome c biogenesis CcdA family protein n=1 Tax=unclassified Rhodopseudomonas TaxID=2638247 RepID=UPI00223475F3|nr:cytochrome c biogenesis protein CcdA [Rhodopseudomonas sp. P2A-2r]UZE49184.1 sulfite exporter TauE/SafE family protein [Rhodopseudomonas sp. P2A-2r]
MTSLALAFAAGLLSILSPCVLPLVPIVLGAAVTEHRLGAVALAAGLAVSFTLLGLLLALVGFSLGIDASVFRAVAAVIMIALGTVLLVPVWQVRLAAAGGPISGWADRQFGGGASSGLGGQFAIGLLLGAVWSPCVGPTLGAASLLAAQGKDLLRVALTMIVFGIGAALPLVLLGELSRATLMRLRTRLLSAGKFGKSLLGVAFIVIGVAIVSGADKTIEAVLVNTSPPWLTELTTSF